MIGMVVNYACMLIAMALGIVSLSAGLVEKIKELIAGGLVCFIIGFSAVITMSYDNTQYISAEPLAYNQTQTVFATDEGTYTTDGLYPDGTYLLTVDGNDVLVVWQAVDGEVG